MQIVYLEGLTAANGIISNPKCNGIISNPIADEYGGGIESPPPALLNML